MELHILVLNGVFDTGLAVLQDTFATANTLAAGRGVSVAPLKVRLVGVEAQIVTARGLTARLSPARVDAHADWVIVPALNVQSPIDIVAIMERADVPGALALLRRWHDAGVHLAAACAGTFLLAEAGILDGCEATTSWPLAPLFRQRYPNVWLDDTRMIVPSRGVVTAGVMMAHLDLALWLVRQASPDIAAMTARFMMIDERTSQARYVIPDFLAHADPLIARFEHWVREHLAAGFSLQNAANELGVTPRTLQRRTEAVLGKTPIVFVQDIRVERARHLLSIGRRMEQIASEVGYADTATLRTLMRRRIGRGLRGLQSKGCVEA
jgi:transcriptional regulator GlxA family with amidase domain